MLSFDGDNDYVNLGDVEAMDQADRFTISLWFKRSADSSTVATSNGIDNVEIARRAIQVTITELERKVQRLKSMLILARHPQIRLFVNKADNQ